jgi:hypothetical protein
MRATMNYVGCLILVLAGLTKLYINLQQDAGVFHWVVVALMLVGAFYCYSKAEQVAD